MEKEDDEMEGTIERYGVNKKALTSAMDHKKRNIPPRNDAATCAREAYPLEEIIYHHDWEFLQDVYRNLQQQQEEAPHVSWDSYPCFVSKRINKLQELKDEEEKRELAGIFSFINHLVKYKDLLSADGFSSPKRHKFPGILNQRFSNLFGNSEHRSTEQDDLLISYVLVLTLFADGFKTDRMNVARDLRIDTSRLKRHYEQLGCKLEKLDGKWIFTLPVPLELPKVLKNKRSSQLESSLL